MKQLSNRNRLPCLLSLIIHERGWENSWVCITVKNTPNPLSVYIRLRKHRKTVFYCFYKLTFPRQNSKLFVMALIKREILTSCKVLYTKSCTCNQFLFFCKKDAFQNMYFSFLKCQLKQKSFS